MYGGDIMGKEIVMINSFNSGPAKFGFYIDDQLKTMEVDEIINVTKNASESNYICKSRVEDEEYTYELMHDMHEDKWFISDIHN